ncbi:MAG TPA: hypothetical protein VGM41_20535 [Chitinophagaceae bacterium]|jgi:hypothetical protein
MQTKSTNPRLLLRIRLGILFFIVALVVSGVTAFPVETELHSLMASRDQMPGWLSAFITKAYEGISITNRQYPMLAYGDDWLAFAHIVIAMAFIGPLRDPVRNIWVIEWAMLACIAIIPLALIAGPIRSIPFYWQCIDCSFGIFGIIPLWIVRRWIKKLSSANAS